MVENYQDAEWLRQKYWGENLSIRQIATLISKGQTTILTWMEKHDVPRRSASEALRGRKFSLKTRRKISKANRGKYVREKNPNWKGGRTQDGDGYVHIRRPNHPYAAKNGYILEHRLVVERALGRYLIPGELVHHINGIRDDNRLENLELVDHHRRQICPQCGWPMGNLEVSKMDRKILS